MSDLNDWAKCYVLTEDLIDLSESGSEYDPSAAL